MCAPRVYLSQDLINRKVIIGQIGSCQNSVVVIKDPSPQFSKNREGLLVFKIQVNFFFLLGGPLQTMPLRNSCMGSSINFLAELSPEFGEAPIFNSTIVQAKNFLNWKFCITL